MEGFKTRCVVGILLGFIALAGCKGDTHPPVIRVSALDTTLVPLHSNTPLPSATAFDREDLDLSSKIITTGTYNKDSIGFYPIQYEVTDAEGNVGRATCTISVMATPSQLAADYNRYTDCPNSYVAIIHIYPDIWNSNQLVMAAFGDGGYNDTFEFDLLPTGIYKPSVLPIIFYATRIVTDLELSFSSDGRIITLDIEGVNNGTAYQCTSIFTRR